MSATVTARESVRETTFEKRNAIQIQEELQVVMEATDRRFREILAQDPEYVEWERRHIEAVEEAGRAAHFAREAQLTAAICGECRRALAPNEPVWLVPRWRPSWRGRRHVLSCEGCTPAPAKTGNLWFKRPCEGCGRTVWRRHLQEWWWKYGCELPSHVRTFCCERCEQAVYRARRRDRQPERPAPQCAVCGESFAPIRRDAVTCSSACRQRAYRLRRNAKQAKDAAE